MQIRGLFLLLLAVSFPRLALAEDFRLDNASQPLTARIEKTNALLHTWSMASDELARQFYLPGNERVEAVQQALDGMTSSAGNQDCKLPAQVERHLKYTAARWTLIDSLDVSAERIKHFFSINPTKYGCVPRATVSEIFVPEAYLADRQSTAVLNEIMIQLKARPFGQVAYEVTSRFGKPSTGFRGEVLKSEVGDERFDLYKKAMTQGGIGGPFPISGGYLIVQVTALLGSEQDCFDYWKAKAEADYTRLWLRKIYTDTVTTLTRNSGVTTSPIKLPVTDADPAFVLAGSTVTLHEARALLPYVIGNPSNPKFWESIQQQAVEVSLLSESAFAETAQKSAWYKDLKASLCAIVAAQAALNRELSDQCTTETLKAWYNENRSRFDVVTSVSYTLYHCGGKIESAACAATLELLERTDFEAVGVIQTIQENRPWQEVPREIQAQAEGLNAGEWSSVFSLNNTPCRIRLHHKAVETKSFAEVSDSIKLEFIADYRQEFWRRFARLEAPAEASEDVK